MLLGFGFAVNEEDLLQTAFFLTADIVDHLVVVAMTGERLYATEAGAYGMRMTEYGDSLVATHNLGSEGLGLTISYAEDGILGIFDIVGDMVFYATCLHHARGGNDDTGFVAHVEGLGSLYALDILQTVESERVGILLHVFHNLVVETLGMQTHDIGSVDRKRTVYKGIDIGQKLGITKAVESIDHLLGTTDGERGNNQLTLLLGTGVENGT